MSEKSEKKKKNVLLVDDDSFLLNMYSIKFKAAGYQVDVSGGGDDAITKLRGGLAPEAILLDMIMPGMDGLETLAQIRKENLAPKTKFIILSNESRTEDIERAKSLAIDGYIVKATTIPSEVVMEVQKIMGDKAS